MLGLTLIICLPALAQSTSPVELERAVAEFVRELQDHKKSQAWVEAADTVQQMNELDPEHPRAFAEAVLLHYNRVKQSEVRRFLDRLGSAGSPGRSYGEGLILLFQSRFDEADAHFDEALEGYERLDHAAGQAAALVGLASVARYRGLSTPSPEIFDRAFAYYEKARPFLQEIGDRSSTAGVMRGLSQIEGDRGRYAAAIDWSGRALGILEEIDDVAGQAAQWYEVGRLRRLADEPELAVQAFEKSAELRRQAGESAGLVTTLRKLATALEQLGRTDAALARLDEALRTATVAEDRIGESWARVDQGLLLRRLGRTREAAETLAIADNRLGSDDDWRLRAKVWESLGATLRSLGEFTAAGAHLERSLAIAVKEGDGKREAAARHGLASLSLRLGDLSRALTYQQQALALYRSRNDVAGEMQAVNNLGAIYYRLGDLDGARELFSETGKLADELKDPSTKARAMSNLAVLEADAGRHERSLEFSLAAIEGLQDLNPRRAAIARLSAALAFQRTGRAAKADEMLEAALAAFVEAGDPTNELAVHLARGDVLRERGELTASLAAYDLALGQAETRALHRQIWEAHAGRAGVLESVGKHDQALSAYRSAIETIESQRLRVESPDLRMRFLANKIDVYERAIHIRASQADSASAADAFHLTERARARSLAELLAESRASLRASIPEELAERERRLLDSIGSLAMELRRATTEPDVARARKALERAQRRQDRLEVELRRAAGAYGEIVYPEATTVKKVQRSLEPGEVLLEYSVGDGGGLLWVVRRKGLDLHRLPSANEIERAVAAFFERGARDAPALGGRRPGMTELETLSALVLPAKVDLTGLKRLIVVPDGALHRVPFGALRREGRFLIENHETVVAPSATTFRWMRATGISSASTGFAGLGDPRVADDDERFSPLRFAGGALRSAADRFPATERVVLTGADFTAERLRSLPLSRYRFVHFATHGWLDGDQPRHSGLLLSPSGEDDFLYLDEILELDLNAEVVVLASCKSGAGELLRGEGLIGLTRAFLYSGAASVLVSQWNVNDRSTARFMDVFYENIARGVAVPSALRAAKLSFLKSDDRVLHQPYRWAPFVLVGHAAADGSVNPVSVATTN